MKIDLTKQSEAVKVALGQYLKSRPFFLSLIRAKEVELFQRHLPLVQPTLDFGCGDGFFAEVLFGSQKKIEVGLDIGESRIKEAEKAQIYKEIVVYNGKKIPFADNTFSTIISNCVLEHLPKLVFNLNEIHRVLKPGGIFLTSVASENWEKYLFGNLVLGKTYQKWMRQKQVHLNLYSSLRWEKVFKEAGFKVVSKTGYLNHKAVSLVDLSHYLSIPSLINYKISGRWVIWQNKLSLFPLQMLTDLVSADLPANTGGNIFFILKK